METARGRNCLRTATLVIGVLCEICKDQRLSKNNLPAIVSNLEEDVTDLRTGIRYQDEVCQRSGV